MSPRAERALGVALIAWAALILYGIRAAERLEERRARALVRADR